MKAKTAGIENTIKAEDCWKVKLQSTCMMKKAFDGKEKDSVTQTIPVVYMASTIAVIKKTQPALSLFGKGSWIAMER